MLLKCSTRRKGGKEHRSWPVVESRRVGRSVGPRHVLYLGELNDSQRAAWQKSIEVFDEARGQSRQCASPSSNSPAPAPGARAGSVIISGATCNWTPSSPRA